MEKVRSAWKKQTEGARRFMQTPSGQNQAIGMVYLILITLSEIVTTMVDPQIGLLFHSMVLLSLLVHGSLVHRGTLRRFLILLCLAPLIRMLSLSLPLAKLGLPVIYWYMVIGILLFIAAFVAGRITELGGQRIGWTWKTWPAQLVLGISGFGFGYIEYQILKPGPLAAYVTWVDVVIAGLILLFFTGVLEEYIFRGLMQSAAMQIMGRSGLFFVSVLFAVLHLGYHSFADLFFVLIVGLFFGWWVWKTHSLIGASLAHGIANISLYILFPTILSSGLLPIASSPDPVSQRPTPTPLSIEESNATATAIAGFPPGDIIVDNEDRGFVFSGKNLWLDVTDGYQGDFRWIYTVQSDPDVVASWIPYFHECGSYRVEVFIPRGEGLTDSAQYTIHHRLGTAEKTLSQAAFNGAWAPIGIFEFDSNFPANVQLSNSTGEDPKLLRWISFDAIRWVLIGNCQTGTGMPNG